MATSSSSLGWDSNTDFPVNGDTDDNTPWPNSVHTKDGPDEWWEVDLRREVNIATVVMWNRPDCCGSRLDGAAINIMDANRNSIVKLDLSGERKQSFDIRSIRTQKMVGFEFQTGMHVKYLGMGYRDREGTVFVDDVGIKIEWDDDKTTSNYVKIQHMQLTMASDNAISNKEEEILTPISMDNSLSQQQPLCAVCPYFEVAILSKSGKMAIGMTDESGEQVFSFDSNGCLWLQGNSEPERFVASNYFKEGGVIGCAVCYDQYGQPTGNVSVFASDGLSNGRYKQILQKDDETMVKVSTKSLLFPFVAISDTPTETIPLMNAVGVSRVPNAGSLEPLLERHPQLLQAPIAQLRAFDTVATAVESGLPLPVAFRILNPVKGSSAQSFVTETEEGVEAEGAEAEGAEAEQPIIQSDPVPQQVNTNPNTCSGCGVEFPSRNKLFKHLKKVGDSCTEKHVDRPKHGNFAGTAHQTLLSQFRGGTFVFAHCASADSVGCVTLRGVSDGDANYHVRIGPGGQVAIGETMMVNEAPTEQVLAQGELPAATSPPSFQSVTEDQISSLLCQSFAANSQGIPQSDSKLMDHFVAIHGVEGEPSQVVDPLLDNLEASLGCKMSAFGIANTAKYFGAEGTLPMAGLTLRGLVEHLHGLFNSSVGDTVVQQVLWVRLHGNTISVGTGTAYCAMRGSLCRLNGCAEVNDATRILVGETPGTPRVSSARFSSVGTVAWTLCSHSSALYQGESALVTMYRDGQDHQALPTYAAEDIAVLPDGWNRMLDQALAQFCSSSAQCPKLGSIEELEQIMSKTADNQVLYHPLLRLCDGVFPAVIQTRAAAMADISKMTLQLLSYLPVGDSANRLSQAFGVLAPLVFAKDKEPAIKAALAMFTNPKGGSGPSLHLDRYAAIEIDPTGDSSIFGQVAKGMQNQGSSMFGTVDYHGVNARWWVCKFAGEEGSDAGGLWRDCMSNIADELMSNRTPLFINSGNAVDGEVWVLNPACHDNVKFRFLGQLFGACIRHPAETLPINLAPYIWKKLAGKPVTWEDFSVSKQL